MVRKLRLGMLLAVLAAPLLFFIHAQQRESGGPPAGPAPEARELAENGGFESPGAPVPAGWTWDMRQTGGSGRISADSGVFHVGKASLRLEPNGKNKSDHPLAVSQIIDAAAYRGRRLQFSAYMKAEGGATAVLAVLSIVRGKPTNLVGDGQPSSGGDWVRHAKEYAVPDDPSVKLLLICSADGRSGSAWFDDVSLAYGDKAAANLTAPAKMPAGAAAQPGAPIAASIQVDAASVVRRIPPTLFGANVEWIYNGNWMWGENSKAPDPRLFRLTREMGLTLVRYPGGYYSDFYHWKEGVGPPEKRSELTHDGSRAAKSKPAFGTDEALEFARLNGAELLITVNAGTGTAREAAEWVSYVNRNGQRVRYWEIGNELYINDGSPISKAITVKPEVYAARVREFAQAMRAADPNIRIGAIGGVNRGAYAFVQYRDWDKTVLERAGDQIDFFSVHNAYAPASVPDSADVRSVYRAMLAAPILIRKNLDEVAHELSEVKSKRAGTIPIAVTEWGPLFQVDPKGSYAQHTGTLGSALFVAGAMKAFLESPTTEIASLHVLNDPGFMGWIGSGNGQFPPKPDWIATPRYYAFQLYSRYFGQQLIRSEAVSPTYDSEQLGTVTAVREVPYLDVVCSLSADGKQAFILGINKNFDSPIDASIALNGFSPEGNATAWTLNGSGIDANSGVKPLQAPGVAWGRQAEDARNPRFSRGGPGEVTFQSSKVEGVRQHFTYRFPPHSVTSLILSRR